MQEKSGYPRNQPHGLMFHRFHLSGKSPMGQGSITENEFEKILHHVGITRIQTPFKWLSKVENGCLESQDLCITFDDGLQSQLNVALPILNRYKLKAFWFVFSSVFEGDVNKNEVYNCFATSEFVSFDSFVDSFLSRLSLPSMLFSEDRYFEYSSNIKAKHCFYTENDLKFRFIRNHFLSEDQFDKEVNEMIIEKGKTVWEIADRIWMKNEDLLQLHSEGHTIGLHSYSHPFVLSELTEDEQRNEYSKNLYHIGSVIKAPITSMSHPLNSYGPETLNILNSHNITCGFRSDMNPKVLQEKSRLPNLQLPREDSANLLSSIS
jgi:peptidoglycan/xylan/chitin deacetylase (PgdA/CDA1 family)